MAEDRSGGERDQEIERRRKRLFELVEAAEGDEPSPFGVETREQVLAEAERIGHIGSFAWHVPSDTSYWSDEFYRILGYEPRSIEPSFDAFFRAIHRGDLARVLSAAERTVEAGIRQSVDFRIVRPDGSVRHAHLDSAAIVDARGEATRVVGAMHDITERVEAEAEMRWRQEVLKQAQRIARVGSFEWNPWTGRTVWSEELHRICGIPLDEPGTQELYFSLVHPEDRPRLLQEVAVVTPDRPVPPMEYRIVRRDGAVVEVHAEALPIRDAEGNPSGFIGTVLDITERKRLEAQLLQSQKMEALGRLAGGVAHDFNNLLTVIGVHVERLRKRGSNDRELAEVARAVARAGGLTRQLLAFSRQAVLEKRCIDPVETVRESLRMVRRILGEDVQVAFAPEPDVGLVEGDPTQLEQVLLNLVVNARDALPEGGHIEIGLASVELATRLGDTQPDLEPGSYVVLRVRDDGAGMDPETCRRAFEPFFTTKEAGRGTGLGLAMVFGIASQSGGAVALESSKGRGTEVRVYFPRAASEPTRSCPPPSESPRSGRGELVLVVDDDRGVRRVLADVLTEAGYRVRVENDGDSALAFFSEHASEVAVVVTDVVMPGMRGPELVRRLRARAPALPALYLSGYAQEDASDDDPATHGALLMKPFSPLDLVRRVGDVVQSGASALPET